MKRLSVIAPAERRDSLLRSIASLGCVEISAPENEDGLLLSRDSPELSSLFEDKAKVAEAIDTLSRIAHEKKSMLSPKEELSESELLDTDFSEALKIAKQICSINSERTAVKAEKARLNGLLLTIKPWENLPVSLEYKGSQSLVTAFLTLPSVTDLNALTEELNGFACELYPSSSDREQHYLFAAAHVSDSEKVFDILKSHGSLNAPIKDLTGTARENRIYLESCIAECDSKDEALKESVIAFKTKRRELELLYDRLCVDENRQNLREKLCITDKTVITEGWVPCDEENAVSEALERCECAYEMSDPVLSEDESRNPPVAFKCNRFFKPFEFITELYGMPKYSSIVDPTPVMAPFFLIFFGIMMADVGYGLLFSLLSFLVLRKAKPRGTFGNILKVVFYGGLSMAFWGVMFGSWFADAVAQLTKLITGTAHPIPPVMFDPLAEPLTMLILSCGLGLVHIMVGMGVSAYRQIRQGHVFDAICDVGFWYLIFIGIVLGFVGPSWGFYVALSGVAGILIFGGRASKNIVGKLTGGLSNLYGVTGYVSDILSYSRLLALGLTTAVVGSVVNIMGTLFGANLFGYIAFAAVFVFGHIFNLAINTLGGAVHALRLQYVEFFGKFYDGGGRPFVPAVNKTKYIYIKKTGGNKND